MDIDSIHFPQANMQQLKFFLITYQAIKQVSGILKNWFSSIDFEENILPSSSRAKQNYNENIKTLRIIRKAQCIKKDTKKVELKCLVLKEGKKLMG